MISSILVDKGNDDILSLEKMLCNDFPNIHISGKAETIPASATLVNEINPELLIINIELLLNCGLVLKDYFLNVNFEIIFLTETSNYVNDAIYCNASGYLLKPIQKEHLSIAVNNALSKINTKKENARNKLLAEKYTRHFSGDDVIGIPTIEGFDFIMVKEIIRCEGLQKCTRVITIKRTDIISSYNLGEFRKLLEPYGFYSPHKSHLINLNHILKYQREGNVLMTNNSYVPIAKGKRGEFLNRVNHI
jgi:two-component system LytT family response regulator